jgi:hypothetical protein
VVPRRPLGNLGNGLAGRQSAITLKPLAETSLIVFLELQVSQGCGRIRTLREDRPDRTLTGIEEAMVVRLHANAFAFMTRIGPRVVAGMKKQSEQQR